MTSLKKALGAEPTFHEDGNYYTPSKAASLALPGKSGYKEKAFENKYSGKDNKVLVLCVDEHFLEMGDGKRFKSGNHPVETLVVLMHLENAGFEPVFATLSGKSCKFEEFAMPDEEEINAFRAKHTNQLEKPRVISDVASELSGGEYKAVFIPGGHGAVIGLPESNDTKAALRHFTDNEKQVISICHGPAALLALTKDENPNDFPFKGYEMACFPDSADKLAQAAGYLPGPMPFGFSTILEGLGMKIVSKTPIGVTHVDRNLITGDTPMAANKLGILAAEQLMMA